MFSVKISSQARHNMHVNDDVLVIVASDLLKIDDREMNSEQVSRPVVMMVRLISSHFGH